MIGISIDILDLGRDGEGELITESFAMPAFGRFAGRSPFEEPSIIFERQ